VNQHEAGIRSTNNPEPNVRSSPGNTAGKGAAGAHRLNPASRPGGAYHRRSAISQRAPSRFASSFSANGTSTYARSPTPRRLPQ